MSTSEQEQGFSLQGQEKECRDYCARRGYQLTRLLRDVESGSTLERPGLQMLLNLSDRRAFDVLVIWRRDRLSRDSLNTALVERELRANGVAIETTAAGPQEDTAEIQFANGMLDLFAQFEGRRLAERCKMGKLSAARTGVWPANRFFGYKRDEHGRLVPHPQEAEQLRRAYERYIMGANRRELAAIFGMTERAAIRRLQNPAYKGQASWHGITIPCPPLVDPELWERAQAIMQERHADGGHSFRAARQAADAAG